MAVLLAASCAPVKKTLVLLPLENISGADEATTQIAPLLQKGAMARGWSVAGADAEPFLEKKRVRQMDSVDAQTRDAFANEFGADAMLIGAVYAYRGGNNPAVAISARLVGTSGETIWGNLVSASAAGTEGLLGLGRPGSAEELSVALVKRLMADFPAPRTKTRRVPGQKRPPFTPAPVTFRSRDLQRRTANRICILPFENATGDPDAARLVADVLTIRLAASRQFEVVEAADFRRGARQSGLRTFRGIDSDQLRRLAKEVGTTLFLTGTVYHYRDGADAARPPEIQVQLLLSDVTTGRVLWSATHTRRGGDYQGLLLRGAVTSGPGLVDRLISEMVHACERARGKGSR
jgi:TolB-like protein